MKNKAAETAAKYVGYLEKKSRAELQSFTANAGSGNYTMFAERYREWWGKDYQAQPWCAVFVSCVFREAMGKDVFPAFAYCPTGVNWFKQQGLWHEKNPQAGDLIFFKDASGVACHVGIVEKTENGMVYTVEGNTSSREGVVANGGAVERKSYYLTYGRIMGYGRPKTEEEMTIEEFGALMEQWLSNQGKKEPSGWSAEGRAFCEKNGIITGDEAGNMQYKKLVTREELAVMLMRAAK